MRRPIHQLAGGVRALAVLAVIVGSLASAGTASANVTGAIFTTDSTCTGVNFNVQYATKQDVYINGGPQSQKPGAAGLPDGYYYVKVTEPDGTLLGTSIGSSNATPVHVTNGSFDQCYQLSAILIKASDGTAGYDDTTNAGGEYKVWVSNDGSFAESQSKTDNFKVKQEAPPAQGRLEVIKFYDANTNGVKDAGEPELTGWMFNITDSFTADLLTPQYLTLGPDIYLLHEYMPAESNWVQTAALPGGVSGVVTENVVDGSKDTVSFGNVCLGPGGGLTLGFWSNKNGQALITSGDLATLRGLNLVGPTGSFDPTAASQVKSWLLSASATNMAYMLSAQLTAMELNVAHGFVSGGALVYAPGTVSANPQGFAKVSDLMAEANTELGLHAQTLTDSTYRSYQEALKTALDKANNNLTFAQSSPCAYTFPAAS